MKLAEALILRADAQKRLMQLRQRLMRNALVQEGDQPAENPTVLLTEVERITAQLQDLIQRINRTNSTTAFDGEMTLADALAVRDMLRQKHGIFSNLAQTAVGTNMRHTRSEVKFVATVNVADVQQEADALAKAHRDLDSRIQAANWTVDLVD